MCIVYIDVSVNWVDVFVVGFYCDFGMRVWIVSCCFDFQYFFIDFWYFDVEQFDQYFRFGMGDEQLGVMCFWMDSVQYVVNVVVWMEVFMWQYIFMQDYGFSVVIQIQCDIVVVYFFYYVGDDFIFVFVELIDYYCVFGFVDFLYDNLFSGLGGDMVEGNRFDLIFDIVVDVYVFIFEMCCFQCDFVCWLGDFFYNQLMMEGIEIVVFVVDFNVNVDFLFVFFFGGCCQCVFQCFENFFMWQCFFVGNGFNNS